MLTDFTICMAMYGNGAPIGMALILPPPKPTLRGLYRARTACFVVAVGSTALSIAALLFRSNYYPDSNYTYFIGFRVVFVP